MSAAVEIKTKEEKDAELDRRIEALRKKNQALVKRYQEIEEDKKKAEDEGIAVTIPRRNRPHEQDDWPKAEKDTFVVTVDLSKPGSENRMVNDRKSAAQHGPEKGDAHRSEKGDGGHHRSEGPPLRTGGVWTSRGGQRGGGGGPRAERREPRPEKREPNPERPQRDEEGGERPARGGRTPRGGGKRGRGGGGRGGGGGGEGGDGGPGSDRKTKEWEEKRKQNIAKMNEEMEKIAEYERGQRADGDKNPIRNFLDDPRRCGPVPDMDRKEGSRRHVRNWGGLDFESVKTGAEVEKEWMSHRSGGRGGSVDMTLSMTGRERAEYLRWKKEREQIDEERLARHRNATGQWRREWDAEKTDTMFKEDPEGAGDVTPRQGNRRDDNKRAPRPPKFADFLGTPSSRDGDRRGKGQRRGRGQDQNYSMHDNRWKTDKEEEKGQKEECEKGKEEPPKEKTEVKVVEEKPAPEPTSAATPTVTSTVTSEPGGTEEDEDEWEDASDGDDDGEEDDGEEDEDDTPGTPPHQPTTSSPKEKRTPRVRIPPPQEVQASPEGGKPLSPFSPLEGHQPVTDWGEEMEMLSPRTSMEESPLRPSSSSETNTSQEIKGQDSPAHTEDSVTGEMVEQLSEASFEAPAEVSTQQSESTIPPKEEEQTNETAPQAPDTKDISSSVEDGESTTTTPPQKEEEENPPNHPASG